MTLLLESPVGVGRWDVEAAHILSSRLFGSLLAVEDAAEGIECTRWEKMELLPCVQELRRGKSIEKDVTQPEDHKPCEQPSQSDCDSICRHSFEQPFLRATQLSQRNPQTQNSINSTERAKYFTQTPKCFAKVLHSRHGHVVKDVVEQVHDGEAMA